MVDWIGKLLVPVVVLAALAFFRKQYRSKSRQLSDAEIDRLDERFATIRWLPVLAMVVVGVAFVFVTHTAPVKLNQIWASSGNPSDIRLYPQTAIWWFFPGFGALSLSWEITLQIWAAFGDRATVNLYSDWSNVTSTMWSGSYRGMDSRKVLRVLSLVITLPIGLFTVLALPMHATIGPTTITDCGYGFKPCVAYPLSAATRMTEIEGFRQTNGNLTKQAGLVVDFRDGRRWNSADWGNFEDNVDPKLEQFLAERTGLMVGRAVTEEDIPPVGEERPSSQ